MSESDPMATASFRFYAELNDFLPAQQRRQDIPIEFLPPCPVRHLIETFGVPHTEVEIILIDGRSVGLDEKCNAPVRRVTKADVAPCLEPVTQAHYSVFWQCSGCRQVYWKGTKVERYI